MQMNIINNREIFVEPLLLSDLSEEDFKPIGYSGIILSELLGDGKTEHPIVKIIDKDQNILSASAEADLPISTGKGKCISFLVIKEWVENSISFSILETFCKIAGNLAPNRIQWYLVNQNLIAEFHFC